MIKPFIKLIKSTLVSTCFLFTIFDLLILNLPPAIALNSNNSRTIYEIEIIKSLASNSLLEKCKSNLAGLSGNPDSAQLSEVEQLEVKDVETVVVNGRELTILILGCLGPGELILIDSTKEGPTILRKEINIPGKHAIVGDLQDLNNDSIPELSVNFSAGAHGMYTAFLSIYQNSIEFVPIEGKSNRFFAITGAINVLDLDNDGIMEIKIGPDLNEPETTQYVIYRWTGNEYKRTSPK